LSFGGHAAAIIREPPQDNGEGDGAESAPRFLDETPVEWEPWLQALCENIRQHVNPPAALGSGHRSLSDKVAAETYKWSLQEGFGKDLSAHAQSYISYTSDMGIELGIADFAVPGGAARLLPNWVHRGDIQADAAQDEA
jgi:hypothetical protein